VCGRFTQQRPTAELAALFAAEPPSAELQPTYNLAPTDDAAVVVERGDRRAIRAYRWGLIPAWAKDAKIASKLFNARAETLATSGAFRESFRRRRCIVPADGFYEWHKTKTGSRQPHYFSRADGEPLAFAGLAERWREKGAPQGTPYLRSCTVITTPGGADMAGIHDRMPVILDPATFDVWLDPANDDAEELLALLHPPSAGTVVHHPVGPRVGNVRNNEPALIEPV